MTDFQDQVHDARAELAHDGLHLTSAQIVRHTLEYERAHSHLHLGRHPFGLPVTVDSSIARVMTPAAAARPLSSGAAAAAGHHLPDLAA